MPSQRLTNAMVTMVHAPFTLKPRVAEVSDFVVSDSFIRSYVRSIEMEVIAPMKGSLIEVVLSNSIYSLSNSFLLTIVDAVMRFEPVGDSAPTLRSPCPANYAFRASG